MFSGQFDENIQPYVLWENYIIHRILTLPGITEKIVRIFVGFFFCIYLLHIQSSRKTFFVFFLKKLNSEAFDKPLDSSKTLNKILHMKIFNLASIIYPSIFFIECVSTENFRKHPEIQDHNYSKKSHKLQ